MICIAKTAKNSLKLENNSTENNYLSYKIVTVRKEVVDRSINKICVYAEKSA